MKKGSIPMYIVMALVLVVVVVVILSHVSGDLVGGSTAGAGSLWNKLTDILLG